MTRDESTHGGSSDVDFPADSSSRLAALSLQQPPAARPSGQTITHGL